MRIVFEIPTAHPEVHSAKAAKLHVATKSLNLCYIPAVGIAN